MHLKIHNQSLAHIQVSVVSEYQSSLCGPNKDYASINTALTDGCYNFLQTFGVLTSKQQKSILIAINIMTVNEHLGLQAL